MVAKRVMIAGEIVFGSKVDGLDLPLAEVFVQTLVDVAEEVALVCQFEWRAEDVADGSDPFFARVAAGFHATRGVTMLRGDTSDAFKRFRGYAFGAPVENKGNKRLRAPSFFGYLGL